jgi:hypothetical protein
MKSEVIRRNLPFGRLMYDGTSERGEIPSCTDLLGEVGEVKYDPNLLG